MDQPLSTGHCGQQRVAVLDGGLAKVAMDGLLANLAAGFNFISDPMLAIGGLPPVVLLVPLPNEQAINLSRHESIPADSLDLKPSLRGGGPCPAAGVPLGPARPGQTARRAPQRGGTDSQACAAAQNLMIEALEAEHRLPPRAPPAAPARRDREALLLRGARPGYPIPQRRVRPAFPWPAEAAAVEVLAAGRRLGFSLTRSFKALNASRVRRR